MDYTTHLWQYGRFRCEDCGEELDDIFLIKTETDREVCEYCAVKCSICENKYSEKELIQVNGDDICPGCRDELYVIYDKLHGVFLDSCAYRHSTWCGDKSEVMLLESRIEAQEYITAFLGGNKRYEIQKL